MVSLSGVVYDLDIIAGADHCQVLLTATPGQVGEIVAAVKLPNVQLVLETSLQLGIPARIECLPPDGRTPQEIVAASISRAQPADTPDGDAASVVGLSANRASLTADFVRGSEAMFSGSTTDTRVMSILFLAACTDRRVCSLEVDPATKTITRVKLNAPASRR